MDFFPDLMSNIICSFECQISRRTIDQFLVVVLMKGSMKRPSSVSAVAPVKKTGKEKAQASNATDKGQTGKTVANKLTKGALKAHEELLQKGATNEAQALLEFGKLDKNAQQSLWKAFELQRKSAGVRDDYKSHVGTGAGIVAKKTNCWQASSLTRAHVEATTNTSRRASRSARRLLTRVSGSLWRKLRRLGEKRNCKQGFSEEQF